jgi:hypothetical protein
MNGKDEEALPEAGDVRIGANGQVEVFDGATWSRYRPLPDSGRGTIFRGHGGHASVSGEDSDTSREEDAE